MGAWGVQTFDNDTACDWTDELAKTSDLSLVEKAIDAFLEADGELIDADLGCEALAACEAIARLDGHWGVRNSYTEDIDKWVESHSHLRPGRDLVSRASQAIDRVLSEESELRDLWAETKDFKEWVTCVKDLQSRVNRGAKGRIT